MSYDLNFISVGSGSSGSGLSTYSIISSLSACFTSLSKDLQDCIPSHLREEYSNANRNPMLASVPFSEHPVLTREVNHASAILFALPFVFVRFCEVIEEIHVCGRLTGDLIKAILQEREVHRASALRTHARQASDRQDGDAIKELGYCEFVVYI